MWEALWRSIRGGAARLLLVLPSIILLTILPTDDDGLPSRYLFCPTHNNVRIVSSSTKLPFIRQPASQPASQPAMYYYGSRPRFVVGHVTEMQCIVSSVRDATTSYSAYHFCSLLKKAWLTTNNNAEASKSCRVVSRIVSYHIILLF
jgi:hypothetical protein